MAENEIGNCPECGAQSVPLVNLLCQICDARRIQEEKLSEAAKVVGERKPLAEVGETEDFDTSSLMDKNDILIYTSAIHFYGARFQSLEPEDAETILADNERMMGMMIRETARQLQIQKIKEQAIRHLRRQNKAKLSLTKNAEIAKADKKFETGMKDWDALSKDSAISKKNRKLSPKAKKVEGKLKSAILAGAFSDEAVEEFKAKRAALAAAKKAAAEKNEAEKENGEK